MRSPENSKPNTPIVKQKKIVSKIAALKITTFSCVYVYEFFGAIVHRLQSNPKRRAIWEIAQAQKYKNSNSFFLSFI